LTFIDAAIIFFNTRIDSRRGSGREDLGRPGKTGRITLRRFLFMRAEGTFVKAIGFGFITSPWSPPTCTFHYPESLPRPKPSHFLL